MLTLEFEFLSGVCYAGVGNDRVPEYPPQFDRAFSSLVAAWGARGCRDGERAALEWLECQPAPRIAASSFESRTMVDAFVPPNDAASGRVGSLAVLPAYRPRQPRRFPAVRPDDSKLQFIWQTVASEETLQALDAVAKDVSYLGHSSSLVRARFVDAPELQDASPARRSIYPGRLAELERAYHRGERPVQGAFVLPTSISAPERPSVFAEQWLVLPGMPGWAPDPRAFPLVAKRMRDALMASFGRSNLEIPEWISGHADDGSPTRHPHLAIVPMLDVGFSYSESQVLGLALVPPRDIRDADDVLVKALIRLRVSSTEGPAHMALVFDRQAWKLAFTDDDARASLAADRWIASDGRGSSVWASATPIALDRHLHARTASDAQQEVEDVIKHAFRHIGLPEPVEIRIDKHASVSGAIPATPSSGSPAWLRWQLPKALASRPLVHARFRFSKPLVGPMIIGAGRFVGLGLCLPLQEKLDNA